MKPPGQLHRSSSLRSGSLSRKPGNGASSSNRLERRQSERKPRKAMKRTRIRARSARKCREDTARARLVKRLKKVRGPLCQKCKHAEGVHPHHLLMKSQGGTDAPANLRLVCAPCHRGIHNHVEESYRTGWLIRRSDNDPITPRRAA